MFVFYYPLRKYSKPRGIGFLIWVWLDDEDGFYGTDWWRTKKKLKDKHWWTAFNWLAVRNKMWNLFSTKLMKPRRGWEQYVDHTGSLHKNFTIWRYDQMAVLKWVNSGNINRPENNGEYLTIAYSVIGKMLYWYKRSGALYFRYSYARKAFSIWKWDFWIEFHAGTTMVRHTIRGKIYINPKIFEYDYQLEN